MQLICALVHFESVEQMDCDPGDELMRRIQDINSLTSRRERLSHEACQLPPGCWYDSIKEP